MQNKDETRDVGQFIPIHYHFNMLNDPFRMSGFKSAIDTIVKDGDTVLELGGGTGVQSFFAAQKAAKAFYVEYNLDLVYAARKLLSTNPNGDRVEIIHADAFEYTPPIPIDVVICEMLHVGLLCEKQMEMIAAFKERYAAAFPEKSLPFFIPGATLQAIQPVQQDFNFDGYHAPVIQMQDAYAENPRTLGLGDPVIYHQLMYDQPYPLDIRWQGQIQINSPGKLNALRIITKSILAIVPATQSMLDWSNNFLIFPLENEIEVQPGQTFTVTIDYPSGAVLSAFRPVIKKE
jgi:predicted RNA methylase